MRRPILVVMGLGLALAGCGGTDKAPRVLDEKQEVAGQVFNLAGAVFAVEALSAAARYTAGSPGVPPTPRAFAGRAMAKAAGDCVSGGTRTEARSTRSYAGPFSTASDTFQVLTVTYSDCRDVGVSGQTSITGVTSGGQGPEGGGAHALFVDYGNAGVPYHAVVTQTTPPRTDALDVLLHEDALENAAGDRISQFSATLDAASTVDGATRHATLSAGTSQSPARMIVVQSGAQLTYALDLDLTVVHEFGEGCPQGTLAASSPQGNPVRYDPAQDRFVGGTVTLRHNAEVTTLSFQANGDATVTPSSGNSYVLTAAEQAGFESGFVTACGG